MGLYFLTYRGLEPNSRRSPRSREPRYSEKYGDEVAFYQTDRQDIAEALAAMFCKKVQKASKPIFEAVDGSTLSEEKRVEYRAYITGLAESGGTSTISNWQKMARRYEAAWRAEHEPEGETAGEGASGNDTLSGRARIAYGQYSEAKDALAKKGVDKPIDQQCYDWYKQEGEDAS